MNLRQLKKQDKRAAALLIASYAVREKAFLNSDDGRYGYDYRSSYEYDEWEFKPAWDEWCDRRAWAHPNACAWYGFDEITGADIPVEQRPRRMTRDEASQWYALRAPCGFRWRGRRLVPVDVHGAMVRKGQRAQQREGQ